MHIFTPRFTHKCSRIRICLVPFSGWEGVTQFCLPNSWFIKILTKEPFFSWFYSECKHLSSVFFQLYPVLWAFCTLVPISVSRTGGWGISGHREIVLFFLLFPDVLACILHLHCSLFSLTKCTLSYLAEICFLNLIKQGILLLIQFSKL